MKIPCYPDFTPLSIELQDELHPRLSLTADGVSEYTFAGLYLFRKQYGYRVSRGPDGAFIISGEEKGKKFFMTPCAAPEWKILQGLLETHDYWKGISDSVLIPEREGLEERGIVITEDRDNFDYLYLRGDLAELSGKKYHKKRNLVNAFLTAYPDHAEKPLTPEQVPGALAVLDRWREDKEAEGDYPAAREALELFGTLALRGAVYYVQGRPVGWCLGESLARGRSFAIHFEKGIDEYKGIYQFINQSFAASLPAYFTHINREQDLGDEGLRQAKMTYRPAGFVQKYQGRLRP